MFAANHEILSWGRNSVGQLGHVCCYFYFFRFQGDAVVRSDPTLIVFDDLNDEVIMIGAGQSHSCAVTASGKLFTWGYGSSGQLGHGDTSNQNKPKLVEALRDTIITQIGTGSAHSCHNIAITGAMCLFI